MNSGPEFSISPWVSAWRLGGRVGIDPGFICLSLFSIKTTWNATQIWCPRNNMASARVSSSCRRWCIRRKELVQQRSQKRGEKQKARVLSDERNWCGLDASSLPVLSSSFEYHQPFASQADANCQPLLRNISLFSGRGAGWNRISPRLNRYLPRVLNQKLSATSLSLLLLLPLFRLDCTASFWSPALLRCTSAKSPAPV